VEVQKTTTDNFFEAKQILTNHHQSRYPLQVLIAAYPAKAALMAIPGFPVLSGLDYQHPNFKSAFIKATFILL
jgi:hypothetical protein